MALKRLHKELQCWEEREWPATYRTCAEETQFWTAAPMVLGGYPDMFRWAAVLRPGRGPFRGGHLAWGIEFPSEYPFRPPRVRSPLLRYGVDVAFEDAVAGVEVVMTPAGCDGNGRYRGRVVDGATAADCVVIHWNGPDDGGPPTELGIPPMREETSDWWVSGANAVLAGAQICHPFVQEAGGVCLCGLKDAWHPSMPLTVVLAFLRVAVEEPASDSGMKPVPSGSEQEMCFCMLNCDAGSMYAEDSACWSRTARCRFFGGAGTLPLCLSAARQGQDEITIDCSNVAGDILGSFTLHLVQDSLPDLVRRVQAGVPLPERASCWQLVLPDGKCLDETRLEGTLAELLL